MLNRVVKIITFSHTHCEPRNQNLLNSSRFVHVRILQNESIAIQLSLISHPCKFDREIQNMQMFWIFTFQVSTLRHSNCDQRFDLGQNKNMLNEYLLCSETSQMFKKKLEFEIQIQKQALDVGGFHLHLLVFPVIYQFNSRIGVLVHSSFANDQFRWILASFQHHFKS